MATKIESLSDDTRDELAQLALSLSGNPKTRKGLLGLVKEAAPGTPIPELDEPARMEGMLAEERKARETFEQGQRDRWLQQDLSAKKRGVMETHGLSDTDMKAIEERMGKGELPVDYSFAARLYKQEIEPVGATNYGSGGYGPFEMPAADGLLENESNWSLKTAHQLIDEIQKKNGRSAF